MILRITTYFVEKAVIAEANFRFIEGIIPGIKNADHSYIWQVVRRIRLAIWPVKVFLLLNPITHEVEKLF